MLLRASCLSLALSVAAAGGAHAQLSIFEEIFDRLTDVSLYVGSNLTSNDIGSANLNVSQFGIELIYDIAATTQAVPGQPADSVDWTWTGTQVRRGGTGADTTYTYSMAYRAPPVDTVMTFELGLGYGQTSAIEMLTEEYTVVGSVRDFPSASLYVSDERSSFYAGLRSGLIQTSGLQAYDAAGTTLRASATAFQVGGLIGYAPRLFSVFPFLEAGWVFRQFGSIDWEGDVVPTELPRRLNLSGWQLVAGVQVSVPQ